MQPITALALLALVAGCAQGARITVPEGLTLNEQAAARALEQAAKMSESTHGPVGRMTPRQLCAVKQSTALAEGLVKNGWRAWLQGDEAAARGYLGEAQDALAGVGAVASYLISQNCT